MNKIISLLLSFSLLLTQAAPAFAQTFKRPALPSAPRYQAPVAVRDATAMPALEQRLLMQQKEAERHAKVAGARVSVDALMKRAEQAQAANDFAGFYDTVSGLNAVLLSYLSDELTETRLLGAVTLGENLRLHLITPQDAEKAYEAFEKIVAQASSCSGLQCEFYSAAARGLAHSRKFHELEKEFFDAGWQELPRLSKAELNRQRRLNLLKEFVSRDFGSDVSNAQIVSGVLPAVAAMGSLKDLDEAVASVVNPDLNWYRAGKNRNSYTPKNAQAQIAAMDSLLDLGPLAQPVLKKYAFNQYSFVSYVHANINLAYTGLSKADDERNKNNLNRLYCHRDFNLDSRADMEIKQKLAYAYGRGHAPAYITSAGDNSCLVVVPLTPDPRKVAEEWTDVVMGEVTFQLAFFGMGSVISGLKNGVRVLKHFKTIKYVAGKNGMSVSRFFIKGGLKKMPTFGRTLAQAKAAKEAKAVAALVQGASQESKAAAAARLAEGAAQQTKAGVRVSRAAVKQTPYARGPVKNGWNRFNGKNSFDVENVVYVAPDYKPRVPVLASVPKPNPVTKRFPSGMWDEEGIVNRWLEQYKSGYFHPRNQIEAITGMSAQKANNVTEYLYYMPIEEARETILNPLIRTGRLPDFMYDSRLITGTRRLPPGYYKHKFNKNVEKLLTLADEPGALYTNHFEVSDIIVGMRDYSFKQGFGIPNDPLMTSGLRKNWRAIVEEVEKKGVRGNAKKLNELWTSPVETSIPQKQFKPVDGKYIQVDGTRPVSLQDYFSQTRYTAFFKEGKRPDFYLNSEKWLSWENERRNLAAAEFMKGSGAARRETVLDRIQNRFVLGDRRNYLTLDEFGEVMTRPYRSNAEFAKGRSLSNVLADTGADLADSAPSSLKIRINNYEVTGGACQMAITDGGACRVPRPGYDGTSIIDRFNAVVDENVRTVVFDFKTLSPRVVTMKTVPHVKDLKPADLDLVRAGTMIGDRLDSTSDLLRVQKANEALRHIPDLRATIYPQSRLPGEVLPEGLNGGGIGAYLTLFTRDFYPLKKVYRLRFNGMIPKLDAQYYVRKEVSALAGAIHRDRLTFLEQVADRVVTP